MLFNSIDFAIFLPLVFIFYWLFTSQIKTLTLLLKVIFSSYYTYRNHLNNNHLKLTFYTLNRIVNKNPSVYYYNFLAEDVYSKFCNFIGVEALKNNFPWENKTSEVKSL